MRVGLLADIHGNAPALEAVLDAAVVRGVGQLLVAGDLVGYYDQPGEVLRLLDEWDWQGVRGNHEELLAERLQDGRWEAERRLRGSGLLAASRLPTSARDRILGLPHPLELSLDGRRVLLCHGAPWDVGRYVYPDAGPELRERVFAQAAGFELVVLGHTHHPMVWDRDGVTIANPGSVGQPRDRIPGACWAVWDTRDRTVELRRESYDISTVQQRAMTCDPDVPYLWEVLTRT